MDNWHKLFERLRMDSETIVFEKQSFNNDVLLKHLSGGVICKTHIYIRSDVDTAVVDYIRAHELCHQYLIFEQGYYYYLDEAGTEDPLFSLIMSFSHHFTIDKILTDCGFNVRLWHERQYLHCKKTAEEGFSSTFDAIGKTLNLIELNYWLKNNGLKRLKQRYINLDKRTKLIFDFADTGLKNLIDGGKIFTANGAKEILKLLHNILELPRCKIYCFQVHSFEI